MSVPLLDLQAQYRGIADELDAAVMEVVRSQRFVLGEPVERLEAELAERIGVQHAVGCASGTDALLLPLWALDLEQGSEAVVPAFTFFATAGAVWNSGLRPVFADVDPRTFNVTAETIEAALTRRTRVVIVVHLFGQMADMAPILALAEARGLHVIEDAAQSIDARQRIGGAAADADGAAGAAGADGAVGADGAAGAWRAAGSLGTAGTLSFFPTKNLGAFGDGGMVTTSDDVLADRLRKLRVHGGRQMYHHEMVGTNSRLDALQAAVLRAKLPHLERWTEARRANAARYDEAFAGVDGITPPLVADGSHHVYNQYTIRAADRDGLRARLEAAGIGSGIYYPVPLHLQACFAELGGGEGDFPVSERLAREVLSLPVYPELTREQQDRVIEAVAGSG